MAYWEWGARRRTSASSSAPTASRARAATSTCSRGRCATSWRVVCPDVVGRGESDRLADPDGLRAADLRRRHGDAARAPRRRRASHWVGTSMGGLIGMALAALPGSPIARLVLNDVGPAIDAGRRWRASATYIGQPLTWASEDEAADYLLTISQGFGPHSARAMAGADAADAAPRRRAHPPALRPGDRRAAARDHAGDGRARARRRSGRRTTRSAARRCVLRGAESDVLAPATADGDGARAARRRACTSSPASATRRRSSRPTRSPSCGSSC